MIIISYNLSWATQEDIVAGTEKKFVEACKNIKNNNNNNNNNNKNKKPIKPTKLSRCTQNALNLLVKFINQHPNEKFIICIQEGTKIQTVNFIEELNKQTSYRFKSIKSEQMGQAYLYTIYDKTLGKIQRYNQGELTKIVTGRPYQILQFNKFTVINAHFPHDLTLQNYKQIFAGLSNKFTKYPLKYPLYFAGDFNDHKDILLNQLVNGTVKFGDETFAKIQNMKSVPKTCCWQDFPFHSDYILTTNKKVSSSFKVLDTRIGNNNNKVLSSDHMPVYLQTGGVNPRVQAKTIRISVSNYNSGNGSNKNPLNSKSYYFNRTPVTFTGNNNQIKLTKGYALCKEEFDNQQKLNYKSYEPVGLRNVKNTCHLNAWIQLLYRCDFYRLGIMNDLSLTSSNYEKIIKNFKSLFEQMSKGKGSNIDMNRFVNQCQINASTKNIKYRQLMPLDYFFKYSVKPTFEKPILNQLFKNNFNDNYYINLDNFFGNEFTNTINKITNISNISNNSKKKYANKLLEIQKLLENKTIRNNKGNIKNNKLKNYTNQMHILKHIDIEDLKKILNHYIIASRYILFNWQKIKEYNLQDLLEIQLKSSLYNNLPKTYRLLSIIVNLGDYHYVCFTRKDDNTFYLINDNEKILNYDINNINKYIHQDGNTAEMLCYELVD